MITVGRRPATGGTNADVFVMRADGRNIRQVTTTVLYDSYPDWGPGPEGTALIRRQVGISTAPPPTPDAP